MVSKRSVCCLQLAYSKKSSGFRTVSTVPGEKSRYDTRGTYKDESLMLTGDLNVINVQWIVQYRIEDPIRYLFQVRDISKTIRDTTEAVMRRAVGNRLGSECADYRTGGGGQ
ncbi:SPFH domain-containing protein [uncultured Desulfobacter sp.]|uniref:SPFH domain-containing protein n=1 Tax=uncultured Desulfobacter sp. TaxID=240139 RepID=UPI0037493FB0